MQTQHLVETISEIESVQNYSGCYKPYDYLITNFEEEVVSLVQDKFTLMNAYLEQDKNTSGEIFEFKQFLKSRYEEIMFSIKSLPIEDVHALMFTLYDKFNDIRKEARANPYFEMTNWTRLIGWKELRKEFEKKHLGNINTFFISQSDSKELRTYPLHVAKSENILKWLLSNGADPNQSGNPEMRSVLIRCSVSDGYGRNDKMTPIEYRCRIGDYATICTLVKLDSSPDTKIKMSKALIERCMVLLMNQGLHLDRTKFITSETDNVKKYLLVPNNSEKDKIKAFNLLFDKLDHRYSMLTIDAFAAFQKHALLNNFLNYFLMKKNKLNCCLLLIHMGIRDQDTHFEFQLPFEVIKIILGYFNQLDTLAPDLEMGERLFNHEKVLIEKTDKLI